MTVYVFDKDKMVRQALASNQITALQHDENNHKLRADVPSSIPISNGEHIGFRCADDKFRLFAVETAMHNDRTGVTELTAMDAIVAELQEIIVEDKQQLDVDLHTAIAGLLTIDNSDVYFVTSDGEDFVTADGLQMVVASAQTTERATQEEDADSWTIRGTQPEAKEKSKAYYATAWEMLKTFEQLYQWRIVTYYEFSAGTIGSRVIETMPDEPIFRGRILSSGKDASNVHITKTGKPVTRLYPLGPSQGSEDVQTHLTIADAEWSLDAGDPADKPKGQTWIEDAEAVAKYGVHTAKVLINDAGDEKDLMQKGWQELQRQKEPKVSVEALVADLEMLPGHSHLMIRLGDLVAIRLKDGSVVAGRIISIKRDYINPALTKIVVGNKKDALTSQVSTLIADAVHTFERLTIYKNRFREDEALIQLNAKFIQMNADAIEANAEEIRLNAEKLLQIDAELVDINAEVVNINAEVVNINAELTTVKKLVAESITSSTLEAEIAALGNLHVGGSLEVPGSIQSNTLWVTGLATLDGGIDTVRIDATDITCTSLTIGENTLYMASLTVVTGIDVKTNLEGRITAVQPITTQFYYYA